MAVLGGEYPISWSWGNQQTSPFRSFQSFNRFAQFKSFQYFRTGSSKRILYSNPEFDKLIKEEQKTGDHKKRVAILHQAGRILMEDVPFAPLYTLSELYGLARNVIWKGTPDNKILAAEMKIKS